MLGRTWPKWGEKICSIRRARAVPCFWPEAVARHYWHSLCHRLHWRRRPRISRIPTPHRRRRPRPRLRLASPTRNNRPPRQAMRLRRQIVVRLSLPASAGASRIRSTSSGASAARSKPYRPRKSASCPTSRSPNRSRVCRASRRSALADAPRSFPSVVFRLTSRRFF